MKIVFSFFFIMLIFAAHVDAFRVKLTWDPNAEPDLAGYNVFASTRAHQGSLVWSGTANEVDINITDIYFVATAFDHFGNESPYSLEVFKSLPCLGDLDGDGDTDGSDLAAFAKDFGRSQKNILHPERLREK